MCKYFSKTVLSVKNYEHTHLLQSSLTTWYKCAPSSARGNLVVVHFSMHPNRIHKSNRHHGQRLVERDKNCIHKCSLLKYHIAFSLFCYTMIEFVIHNTFPTVIHNS